MSYFLRKLWAQKPKQWGPASAVRRAVAENAEKVYGIDSGAIALALPFWEGSGPVRDYSGENKPLHLQGQSFWDGDTVRTGQSDSNYLKIQNTSDNLKFLDTNYTIIACAKSQNNAGNGVIIGRTDASNGYLLFWANGILILRNGSTVALISEIAQSVGAYQAVGCSLNRDSREINFYNNGEKSNTLRASSNLVADLDRPLVVAQDARDERGVPYNSNIKYISMWSQELKPSQMWALNDNPYSLYQKISAKTYFIPTADAGGLTISNLYQKNYLDATAVSQKHSIDIEQIQQKSYLDEISIVQAYNVNINSVVQKNYLDVVGVTQINNIITSDILQSNYLSTMAVSQNHVLAIENIQQDNHLDIVSVVQAHKAVLENIFQGNYIDTISIIPESQISIDGIFQSNCLDSVNIQQAHSININNIQQSNAVNIIDVVQVHNVSIGSIFQRNRLDSVDVVIVVYSGGGLTQAEHDKLMSLPTVEEIWAFQNMLIKINLIYGIESGKWTIANNQMVFFDETNLNEIARFNLFDKDGSPTMTNVTTRERV